MHDLFEAVTEMLNLATALTDLVVSHPERILLKCIVCGEVYAAKDMQVRKKPGKWAYCIGKKCKGCVKNAVVDSHA